MAPVTLRFLQLDFAGQTLAASFSKYLYAVSHHTTRDYVDSKFRYVPPPKRTGGDVVRAARSDEFPFPSDDEIMWMQEDGDPRSRLPAPSRRRPPVHARAWRQRDARRRRLDLAGVTLAWCLSAKARNKAAHAANGNGAPSAPGSAQALFVGGPFGGRQAQLCVVVSVRSK